ncbi:MAG: hypothetical protein P8M30_17965 [Planctomycetaceae bacterium]|nr:hypothetical protein [Planctomycetaceae bacterium]
MSTSGFFPAELSDFEYLMYRDDSPQYPMSFCLETRLSGQFDRETFERALRSALDRHLLLQATVTSRWNQCHWSHHPIIDLPLDWNLSPSAPPAKPAQIIISQVPGIKIWVRKSGDEFLVVWQFHHACCDGIGSLQFIGDVFAHYGIETAEEAQTRPTLQDLSPELLKQRGDLISTGKGVSSSSLSLRTLIRRFRRLVGRKTMPLAIPPRELKTETRPLMLTHILDRTTLKLLNRFASKSDVNLNSLILREMFLTLRNWNDTYQGLKKNQWSRLGMPLNKRMPQHRGIPACNMVSMMFFPRTAADCDDVEELLQGIQQQTIRTLHNRLGNLLLAGIHRVRKVPGLLPLLLRSKRPFTTAILANVGEVRKHLGGEFPHIKGRCVAGNVVLEHVGGVAPIRNGTRVAVSLGVYGRQLVVNMNCDQYYLSHSQSEQLLKLFVSRLESLSEEKSQPDDPKKECPLPNRPLQNGL